MLKNPPSIAPIGAIKKMFLKKLRSIVGVEVAEHYG